MKKALLWKKCLLSVAAALLTCVGAKAQMAHFYIGSSQNRNEMARAIKFLPDGSCIIAGYVYDQDASHNIINADNLLLRVRPDGTIMWQRRWGTPGNDMLFDMTVAPNGAIYAVGTANRGTLSANNTAAIYLFNLTGTLMNSRFVRDNTTPSTPGEEFASVCVLDNGNVVAVGGHNYIPGAVDGLISVFNATLITNLYNEVVPVSPAQSDHFTGVVANGNEVYITGPAYTNTSTFYDMTLLKYTPGTTSGTINWLKLYDMSYTDSVNGFTINSEWPQKLFVRNSNLMVTGFIEDAFGGVGDRHFIFRSDMNGNTPFADVLNNGTTAAKYSNSSMIYPLTNDELFTTNVPGPLSYNYDQTGVVTVPFDIWPSHITSLTAGTISRKREFMLQLNESVQAIDYGQTPGTTMVNLYLAGNAAPQAHPNDNDIYFAVLDTNLQSSSTSSGKCALDTASALVNVPVTYDSVTILKALFTTTVNFTVAGVNPGLMSTLVCGAVFAHKENNTEEAFNTSENTYGLFPNPVGEYMEIKGITKADYSIVNTMGQQVGTGNIESGKKINVAMLPAGMYFIKVSEDGNIKNFRFIKQ